MLEKALSEVISDEAKREIVCARASIVRMREIINEDRRSISQVANPKRTYKKAKHTYVYKSPNGKWVVKKGASHYGTFKTESEAVKARDKFLGERK
jgi:hypothetical protein